MLCSNHLFMLIEVVNRVVFSGVVAEFWVLYVEDSLCIYQVHFLASSYLFLYETSGNIWLNKKCLKL